MNIDPLIAHFPVVLLALYSVLEVLSYVWQGFRRQSWLFPLNAILIYTGLLGAFAQVAFGGPVADLINETDAYDPLIISTVLFYLTLAAAYCVRTFDRNGWGNQMAGMIRPFMRIWNVKKYLAHLVLDTWVLPMVAFLALIGLVVTGAFA